MEGEAPEIPPHYGQVLILSTSDDEVARIASLIDSRMPGTLYHRAVSLEQFHQILNEAPIDVAVIDHHAVGAKALEVVQTAKVKESTPGVVFFGGSDDSRYISNLYEAGCQKYFLEQEEYGSEMAHVVRSILRLRKLQEENTRLISKLTEANVLLEEKNRRLDEFSATVAHDIRGPLGGVVMKLDYVLDRYKDEINEQFAAVLHRALSSSQRLTDIVQAMYEFAKLGSKATKMGPVALGSLVEEVIRDMNFDEAQDISFVIGELPVIWGNDQLLRRVFINLIGNAVKFNDKSETVIGIQCTGFKDRSISRVATVVLHDNGPGIAESDLKDIFRFFSRGSSLPRETEGLGVGLTVVQRIMELHFGSISVESVVGRGTAFTLEFPTDKIDFIR